MHHIICCHYSQTNLLHFITFALAEVSNSLHFLPEAESYHYDVQSITEVWLLGENKNFILEITLRVKLEANMCANYRGLSGSECIFHHPSP
jgi:hypothetical protein